MSAEKLSNSSRRDFEPSNERALATDNITITSASSVGKAIINPAGAVITNTNNGLNSASQINITANKDPTIYADGVDGQEITLNTERKRG